MLVVSIITPLFNSSKYLEETYKSVINQTYKDFEWIVVDDKSTDDSYLLANKLAQKDSRIKVLQVKENGGAAKARNLGIKNANGRFIAFLDSDDMWMPDKLEKQIDFMLKNNYAFTYSNYEVLNKNGSKVLFNPKKSKTDYKRLLKTCDIGCLTVIYDTEQLGKVYMPEDTPKREDYATWLDITRSGVIAYKLNETLATYRLSDNSVSSKKFSMLRYHYNVYHKHEHFGVLKSFWYLGIHSFNKLFKKY